MMHRLARVRSARTTSRVLFSSVVVPSGPKQPTLVQHGGAWAESGERLPGAFAVVKLGGTQYKVAKDDIIVVGNLEGAILGANVFVKDVLLVGTMHETVIGRPVVPKALVTFYVEEKTKDKKIIVFKKRDRYRRKQGFRRHVTLLRCTDISCAGVDIEHVLFDEPNSIALHDDIQRENETSDDIDTYDDDPERSAEEQFDDGRKELEGTTTTTTTTMASS